ncbi:hypothetical protein AVDCRST_MAG84-5687 [uncultured Microcoleus sp.]|uniref:Uncharacterized protein n=1 Tax=uncultured Microcoleus sp. TaxID=259945 RepID=A0A6J4NU84_9CYAN|nr:hypothetical protein AVDCRST_MAG84-5687 [uncultured Microcoleus sp.]
MPRHKSIAFLPSNLSALSALCGSFLFFFLIPSDFAVRADIMSGLKMLTSLPY